MLSHSTPSSLNENEKMSFMLPRDDNFNLLRPNQRRLCHMRNVHYFNLNLSLTLPIVTQSKHLSKKSLEKGKAKSFTDLNSSFNDLEISVAIPPTSDSESISNEGIRRDLIRTKDLFEKQEDLLKINQQRIVDSFISLHDSTTDQVIYISEIVHRDMNPYFTEFDLLNSKFGNLNNIRIKLWCYVFGAWKFFIKCDVVLSLLVFIGEKMNESQFKEDNTIIVELTDGYYAVPSPFNQHSHIRLIRGESDERRTTTRRFSSSFDQLMILKNLQYCIRDIEQDKATLSQKILLLLKEQELRKEKLDSIQLLEIKQLQIRTSNAGIKQQINKLNANIKERELNLERLSMIIANAKKVKQETKILFGDALKNLKIVEQNLQLQQKNLVKSLGGIFPIYQTNTYSNEFLILNHHLSLPFKKVHMTKNSSLEIAFVLNLVSQLVNLLSVYLSIPLRYPIEVFGSHSYINDPISQMSMTMFPLWINNLHNIERFEYAILLLNKNVEQLIESIGMKVVDHRNLLGNLNILMVCLSDGETQINTTQNHEPSSDDQLMMRKRIQYIKRKKSKLSIISSSNSNQHLLQPQQQLAGRV